MSDWVLDQLGDLVDFQKGKKVATSQFQLAGYERYLGAGSLSGGHDGYASPFLAVQAKENDVLMLWDGERSGLVGHNLAGVVSSTVSKLTPNNKITSSLLYYYLLQNFEWIQNRRTGTGVPHVPKDLARIFKLKYPTDENYQNKIVSILEVIDQTIEKTEDLIHKYQQIKAGLMHDLFTRGLTADAKLRPPREQAPELYQETPIVGWIPKEWRAKELGIACDWYSGGTPSRSNQQWWEGKVPWLSPKDMKFFDLKDTEEHVTKIAAISGSRLMPAGTVFIVIRGMILAHTFPVVYSGSEFCFNQDIKAVSGRDELQNRFLAYWFEANKDVFLKKTTEATHGTKRFDMKDLYDLIIGVPSPDEQQRIRDRLEVLSNRLMKEGISLSKLKKQKFGIMHDLLTGKVPVTIDREETVHGS